MLSTDPSLNVTPMSGCSPATDGRRELVADRLSVVIRAHTACDRALLGKALQSLARQSYAALEVMVVTDALDSRVQQELMAVLQEQEWRAPMFTRLEPVDCAALSDSRSRLLNEGIARSTGQYLAFLDYDDIVYENCYRMLVDELVASGTGVAAGGTRVAEVSWNAEGKLEIENLRDFVHDGRSKVDLWKGNFLPIHSFVINRFLVPPEAIGTEESLRRLEDHCLLIRLSLKSEFSFAKMREPVCEYRVFNGVFSGDRTKFLDSKDPDIESWKQSKEFIQSMVANATASVNVSQLKADIQDRLTVERLRTEEQTRAEAQSEIEALKLRVAEAEQANLALSYQVEKWQASNKALGEQLDQQHAELSRRPYRMVRTILAWFHRSL